MSICLFSAKTWFLEIIVKSGLFYVFQKYIIIKRSSREEIFTRKFMNNI